MENNPGERPEDRLNRPDSTNQSKKVPEKTTSIAQFSGIAVQMLGTIGLGVWLGLKIDAWQGNQPPIWTIVLSLTAIGASLYLFIRQLTNR